MIEANLEFDSGFLNRVLERFLELPSLLKPTNYSQDEESSGETIKNEQAFVAATSRTRSGFFLKCTGGVYDISVAGGKIICSCFLDVDHRLVQEFLVHMARAKPSFGFACAPEERSYRNQVTNKIGANTIESWVGRDTDKYIPGLYWLTLMPAVLAEKHCVPLAILEKSALEHIELDNSQHLFRFYERPEDWRLTASIAGLCASLPGVFDIDKVKPQLATAKTFLDLNTMVRIWR